MDRIERQRQIRKESRLLKKQREEEQKLCAKEGKACDFGICDECPLTIGSQE